MSDPLPSHPTSDGRPWNQEASALLLELTRVVVAARLDDEALAGALLERLAKPLGAALCVIHVLEGARGEFRAISAAGIDEARLGEIRVLRIGDGVCGMVAESREAWIADRSRLASDSGAGFLRRAGATAAFCEPLFGRDGSVVGTFLVASRAQERFANEAQVFVRALCEFLSVVLERWLAQNQLRDSRARLSGIIESAMDAIITIDEQQRIVVFNAAAERVFRCPAAEALGQSLERFIPERFRKQHGKHIRNFGEAGVTRRGMGQLGEVAGLRANGEEFPIEASISHIAVEGQRLFTVILRDVTERRRGENERAHLEAELRQTQKLNAIGTLAGGIAHDFNNILTAIQGNALLAVGETDAAHAARPHLDEVLLACNRARDLVQRIMSFSRRKEMTRLRRVELSTVVDEALRLLRATIPAGVELRHEYDPATPPVRADASQIHQVVLNLVTNAWQAIKEPHGTIELRVTPCQVDTRLSQLHSDFRRGPYARLEVRDNGCGMDSAMVERIFEPFFTTKAPGEGTGLGLSVVHGIVQAHSGVILVESERERGTLFQIFLPADREEVAGDAPLSPDSEAPSSLPRGAGQHILLLDDEEAVVPVIQKMLASLGYRVSAFNRPEDALKALRGAEQGFDLVVTDLNMPGMNGLEFAREVRKLRAKLPIVLMSGFATARDTEDAKQLGILAVAAKPDPVTTIARVAHQLFEPHALA